MQRATSKRRSRSTEGSQGSLIISQIFDDLLILFEFCFRVLAVLSFQIGPDRRNFKSYCVLDPKPAVGTRSEPFRATFRLPKKRATAKNTNFALEGDNRFMKPSWVRAHGLIFEKIYIV